VRIRLIGRLIAFLYERLHTGKPLDAVCATSVESTEEVVQVFRMAHLAPAFF